MINNNYEKISSNDKNAQTKISDFILKNIKNEKEIVILCVGSNNIGGEFLAPLVERFLKENGIHHISGRTTVVADRRNVIKNIIRIKSKYKNPFIIVIASEVGDIKDVGNIILKKDPVPSQLFQNIKVGDIAISAVVNNNDYDYTVQMHTAKLVLVYKMAKVISKGLEFGLD